MEGGVKETNPRKAAGSAFLAVLVVVPALVLAILHGLYGFNLPYWDGWEEYDLFNRVHQHTLTFDDLFAQHNEHRIFFPRLVLISAFFFEPYTDEVELWMVWLLACLSSLCLWGLSRYTGRSKSGDLLLLAVANVLLFNLMAWEDWLWGFQIGFLLPVLCMTAGVWSVSVSRGYWPFLWAFFWSVINTFTVASGFLTWVVLLPLLLFPDGKFSLRWKGLSLHLFGLALCLFFYLHSYNKPGGGVGMPFTVSAVPDALGYFLVYLGAPVADQSGTIISLVMGGFFICLYLVCLALIFVRRREPDVLSRTLPWLTLCHFAMGCALITAVGRMGFGLEQALTSRYVVFSSLLPIGLLFAGAYLFPGLVDRVKSNRVRELSRRLLVVVPVLCFAFYFWNAVESIGNWRQSYRDRLTTQAALIFINVPASAPILEKIAYPGVDSLKKFLNLRTQLGVPQKTLADVDISSLEETSSPDLASGLVTECSRTAAGITLSGWAYLPKAGRAADLVLVTQRDCVVGMAVVANADQLQWSLVLPPGSDLSGLKAWSFDGVDERAYPLSFPDSIKKE